MLLINGLLDIGESCPLANQCTHTTCQAAGKPNYKFTHSMSCGMARTYKYSPEGREALRKLKDK